MQRSKARTQTLPAGALWLVLGLFLVAGLWFASAARAHASAVMPVEIHAGDLNRMVKIAGREFSPADIAGMTVVGPGGQAIGRVVGIAADDVGGNRVLVAPAAFNPWLRTALASLSDGGLPGPERLAGVLSPRAPGVAEGTAATVALAPSRFGRSAAERHVLTVDDATARVIADAVGGGAGLVY